MSDMCPAQKQFYLSAWYRPTHRTTFPPAWRTRQYHLTSANCSHDVVVLHNILHLCDGPWPGNVGLAAACMLPCIEWPFRLLRYVIRGAANTCRSMHAAPSPWKLAKPCGKAQDRLALGKKRQSRPAQDAKGVVSAANRQAATHLMAVATCTVKG